MGVICGPRGSSHGTKQAPTLAIFLCPVRITVSLADRSGNRMNRRADIHNGTDRERRRAGRQEHNGRAPTSSNGRVGAGSLCDGGWLGATLTDPTLTASVL